jgi:hypothetical protein
MPALNFRSFMMPRNKIVGISLDGHTPHAIAQATEAPDTILKTMCVHAARVGRRLPQSDKSIRKDGIYVV